MAIHHQIPIQMKPYEAPEASVVSSSSYEPLLRFVRGTQELNQSRRIHGTSVYLPTIRNDLCIQIMVNGKSS